MGAMRVLVVRYDAIGDYILFRQVLAALSCAPRFAGAQLTLLGNSAWRNLFETLDRERVAVRCCGRGSRCPAALSRRPKGGETPGPGRQIIDYCRRLSRHLWLELGKPFSIRPRPPPCLGRDPSPSTLLLHMHRFQSDETAALFFLRLAPDAEAIPAAIGPDADLPIEELEGRFDTAANAAEATAALFAQLPTGTAVPFHYRKPAPAPPSAPAAPVNLLLVKRRRVERTNASVPVQQSGT